MKNKVNLKFYILIALVVIFIIASIIMHVEDYQFGDMFKKISTYEHFPAIFITLFIISSFFPLPFLTFLGAAIMPFYQVLFYSIIGNIITFTLMFFLARWLGRDYVEKYEEKNKKIKDLDISLKKNAFRDIILLRFFFIIPPEAVNLLGGLSEMRFRDYFLASLIGTVPLCLASILLIKSRILHSVPLFILSVILLLLMLIIPIIFVARLRNYCKNKVNSYLCKIIRK